MSSRYDLLRFLEDNMKVRVPRCRYEEKPEQRSSFLPAMLIWIWQAHGSLNAPSRFYLRLHFNMLVEARPRYPQPTITIGQRTYSSQHTEASRTHIRQRLSATATATVKRTPLLSTLSRRSLALVA